MYMKFKTKQIRNKNITYIIRHAEVHDAKYLSELRFQIDGETEYLDRAQGENFLSEIDFESLIYRDKETNNHLFLVAELDKKIVGFCRCEGNSLQRFSHKVEFGVCILKNYWGYSIGKNFLKQSIQWAETQNIKKITLNVLETNDVAIKLYKQYGFEVEGVLKKDKRLSDGNYYNTILMARLNDFSI